MRVEVTQADILAGSVADCSRCPIALAIRRAMPHVEGVDVGPYRIYVFNGTDGEAFKSPDAVTGFVFAYDRGHAVSPFAFELA